MSWPKRAREGKPTDRSRIRTHAGRVLAAAAVTAPVVMATPAAAAPPPPCLTSDLALSWAPGGTAVSGGRDPGTQQTAVVTLRNLERFSCMLDGFPKVTLAQGATTETLTDQRSATHTAVTLEPGTAARFTLTFLAAQSGDDGVIEPVTAIVTPPNNTASKNLRWRWGPVTEQESATRPGNFVGPVHN
ncbi:DUF4232 domain-containing protein [Streptomyces sp. NBC_01619]|uniref:DUF4232 domain-containing protein n=1 Tax=Streptomyces sp. NBC_01619 TaxID=2975901 RepID=UPI00224DDF82|nr:DUF4232 domain-containing protein [Streptomyces sp. NBC_01619]MCX4514500.1 DUF4232 domain-containing protein [Streptomyces sp. NBC_01619]